MNQARANKHVVIYGGGIAGAILAKRLSSTLNVTLVDPRDYFEVPMAAPRNLVKPEFAERAMLNFDQVLPGVQHIQARLVEMSPDGGVIETSAGKRMRVKGDVAVLATGSRFSNPLMRATDGSASERSAFYVRYSERLKTAANILIVGGGPIGVEVAGEISETYPEKSITILEAGNRLLGGTSEAAAKHASAILSQRGVRLVTGERLEHADSPVDDVFPPGGVAITNTGRSIPYDLIIWCIGGQPNTAYMKQHFASVLDPLGRIRVTPQLRVVGLECLFALGDITDLDENKMAWHIASQVDNAAFNIHQVLSGKRSAKDLKVYSPQTGKLTMAVTLGSKTGVAHLPIFGVIRAPWLIRMVKSSHMLVPRFRKLLGA